MSLLGVLSGPKPDERDVKPSAPVRVTGGSPYGRKALDAECLKLVQAQEGERNDTLNRAAFAAGQLVAGGELAENEAEAALSQAAKRCGLHDHEIRATLASGITSGKREPRSAPPRETKSAPRTASGEYDWIDTIEDADNDQEDAPVRTASTIASVLEGWRNEGALIHESTGFPALDELTGGGPVYGSRWYLAGAPDAGKTALLIQLGHHWAERGVTVGFLAVDEEPSDLVARFAQRKGWRRTDTETRDLRTLDAMSDALGALTIRFYDSSWTIESAAKDLREAAGEGKAALLIDSVQTVSCEAERLDEREMSEVAAVTARTKAIRRCATYFRLIAVATSELGRAAYNSDEARRNVSTLAASKWSGSIEYSARVLIGVRSVAVSVKLDAA